VFLPRVCTVKLHSAELLGEDESVNLYVICTTPSLTRKTLLFCLPPTDDTSVVVTGGEAASEVLGAAQLTATPALAVVTSTVWLLGHPENDGASWSAYQVNKHHQKM